MDACEDLIMANYAVTPSNPSVALAKEEELEETPFDANVSQRSCDKELFERVVHTQVDRSAWDH